MSRIIYFIIALIYRPNEQPGKRLCKRKCQDNVSTEKSDRRIDTVSRITTRFSSGLDVKTQEEEPV